MWWSPLYQPKSIGLTQRSSRNSRTGRPRRDGDLAGLQPVLGAATVLDRELTRREQHRAAVGPVDLPLEEEVRGEPLGLRRVDVAVGVGEREPADGGLAVGVSDPEENRDGRLHVEQHGHLAAEAEVLVALPHVEADRRLPLAGLRRVDEGQGVLDP
jgi:hypothetical protein